MKVSNILLDWHYVIEIFKNKDNWLLNQLSGHCTISNNWRLIGRKYIIIINFDIAH